MEVGGQLYGAFTSPNTVVVMLATASGPSTVHEPAHLVMDLDYAQLCDDMIVDRTGLTCVGRWHNHLTSGRCSPSHVDDTSRVSILERNSRDVFLEFILGGDPIDPGGVRLFPYAQVGRADGCRLASVRIMEGYSPVRRFLLGASPIPLDDLFGEWTRPVPLVIEPTVVGRTERAIVEMIESQAKDLPPGLVHDLNMVVADAGVVVRLSLQEIDIMLAYANSAPLRLVSVCTVSRNGDMEDRRFGREDMADYTLPEIVRILRPAVDDSTDSDPDGASTREQASACEGACSLAVGSEQGPGDVPSLLKERDTEVSGEQLHRVNPSDALTEEILP